MNQFTLKAGDFTGLAEDYAKYRPDYSHSVLSALLSLQKNSKSEIDSADVGAGTGIWSKMIWNAGVRSVVAIEPNEDMRTSGILNTKDTNITWLSGSAEETGLPNESVDLLSMASSFHWADFDLATKEFHRVLRPNGRFAALWNPRLIEVNPILVKIEKFLDELRPNIKRISSGRSGITETLTDRLWESPYFDDIVYLEGRHMIRMTPDRYLGAWRSVNDLRVQLGREKFETFLRFVKKCVDDLPFVDAVYLTRAWSARRRG